MTTRPLCKVYVKIDCCGEPDWNHWSTDEAYAQNPDWVCMEIECPEPTTAPTIPTTIAPEDTRLEIRWNNFSPTGAATTFSNFTVGQGPQLVPYPACPTLPPTCNYYTQQGAVESFGYKPHTESTAWIKFDQQVNSWNAPIFLTARFYPNQPGGPPGTVVYTSPAIAPGVPFLVDTISVPLNPVPSPSDHWNVLEFTLTFGDPPPPPPTTATTAAPIPTTTVPKERVEMTMINMQDFNLPNCPGASGPVPVSLMSLSLGSGTPFADYGLTHSVTVTPNTSASPQTSSYWGAVLATAGTSQIKMRPGIYSSKWRISYSNNNGTSYTPVQTFSIHGITSPGIFSPPNTDTFVNVNIVLAGQTHKIKIELLAASCNTQV